MEEIREKLIKKEQIILLLNRKGYSTVVQCYDCGYVEECEHCSIKLNYSSSRRTLKCNYCGVTKNFKDIVQNVEVKILVLVGEVLKE